MFVLKALRPLFAVAALAALSAQPARASVSFSVSFSDEAAPYAAYESEIRSSLLAAGAAWSPYLAGNAMIDIVIDFDPSLATASGNSVSSAFIGTDGPTNIYEQGAANELRTGIDPNGSAPDASITIGTAYLQNQLFFDPSPGALIPANQTDALSVFEHELGHVFAFNGWRDDLTGTLPGDYESPFDALTVFDGSNFFFVGQHAMALYGGPVPLTFGNITHLGNAGTGPGGDLLPDLMNGVVFEQGTRYDISALDVAMFCDVGVSGSCTAALPVPEPASMSLMVLGLGALGLLALQRRRV